MRRSDGPAPDDEPDDFFDDDLDDAWQQIKHAHYLPGIVAIERVVARNDRAIVALSHAAAYPDGIALHLITSTSDHHSTGPTNRVVLRKALDPTGKPLPPRQPRPSRELERDAFREDQLRWHSPTFGVRYPDGTTLTTIKPYHPAESYPQYGLNEYNVYSRVTHVTASRGYFIWPLPAPGTLEIAVSWPAVELAETITAVDTLPLIEAAQRSQRIFDNPDEQPSSARTHQFLWELDHPQG